MLDRLHHYSRLSLRRCACAIAALAISVAAQAGPDGPLEPNPENVLTKQPDAIETLQRLMQPGTAMAAQQRPAERRVYRVRHARAKPKAAEPVAAATEAAPATPLPDALSQPFWPNAQASAGMGDITPFIIRTVREMLESEKEPVVLANELSDIDLAAAIPQPAPAAAATDGRAPLETADIETVAGEGGERLNAMIAALTAMLTAMATAPAAWLESLLLMLSGALAALAALFAARRFA